MGKKKFARPFEDRRNRICEHIAKALSSGHLHELDPNHAEDRSSASHSTQDTRKAMRRPMQTISPIVGHRQETVGDRPLAEG